jgi:hypothetical protein
MKLIQKNDSPILNTISMVAFVIVFAVGLVFITNLIYTLVTRR